MSRPTSKVERESDDSGYDSNESDSQESENIKSWVVYGLRDLLGFEKIRKKILANKLKNSLDKNLFIGPTFGLRTDNKTLDKCIASLPKNLSKKPFTLFTAINLADKETSESHYQTYIVDNLGKKLYMIDPSMSSNSDELYSKYTEEEVSDEGYKSIKSLYTPHISFYIGNKMVKKGYDVYWINTSNRCQSSTQDVFCQTWSLILQIETMKKLLKKDNSPIVIPKLKKERYEIILRFYKNLISDKEFKTEFIKTFKEIESDGFIYSKVNPVPYFDKLTIDDIMG